jgi:hypothetical protein
LTPGASRAAPATIISQDFSGKWTQEVVGILAQFSGTCIMSECGEQIKGKCDIGTYICPTP